MKNNMKFYPLIICLFFLFGLQLILFSTNSIFNKVLGICLIILSLYQVMAKQFAEKYAVPEESEKEADAVMPKTNTKTTAKTYIGKFIKTNVKISFVIFIAAIAFMWIYSNSLKSKLEMRFMQPSVGSSEYTEYSTDSDSQESTEAAAAQSILTLQNCTTNTYNKTVTLIATSAEFRKTSTLLNVTIENHSKNTINLAGSNILKLVDENNNCYNLKPAMISSNFYEPIEPEKTTNIKLVFDGIPTTCKLLHLKGEIWSANDLLGEKVDPTFDVQIK